MATPIDLLDPPAVMSYAGLVDASTAAGHGDDDLPSAVEAQFITATDVAGTEPELIRVEPIRHLAQITRRRGTYDRPAVQR